MSVIQGFSFRSDSNVNSLQIWDTSSLLVANDCVLFKVREWGYSTPHDAQPDRVFEVRIPIGDVAQFAAFIDAAANAAVSCNLRRQEGRWEGA